MPYLSRAALVLPLLLVLAPAARAADDLKMAAESPYYPLKVGNTWYYKIGDTKFEMKVTKLEKVDDQTVARIEMSVGGKPQAVEKVGVKDDGLYRYMFEDKKADPPVRFLKLPPKKDETWEVKSTIGAEKLAGTFKSGEVDELKVPAGTYKNVVTSSSDNLDANGTKISFTYYFAKDVGMIKQTITIQQQQVVIELEKFEAGK
jgi:hypothetical protein